MGWPLPAEKPVDAKPPPHLQEPPPEPHHSGDTTEEEELDDYDVYSTDSNYQPSEGSFDPMKLLNYDHSYEDDPLEGPVTVDFQASVSETSSPPMNNQGSVPEPSADDSAHRPKSVASRKRPLPAEDKHHAEPKATAVTTTAADTATVGCGGPSEAPARPVVSIGSQPTSRGSSGVRTHFCSECRTKLTTERAMTYKKCENCDPYGIDLQD